MAVRLLRNTSEEFIRMGELLDGQIAIIVAENNGHKGEIVQRYGEHCVNIGKPHGQGWSYVGNGNTILVRVLTTGELIEVI
jgi:hypothetical protein